MYGYVIIDKPDMFVKDFAMYRAFYCGYCKSVGKKCSQIMRFTTNYDITFLDVLLHSVYGKEKELDNQVCVLNPLRKKTIALRDELTDRCIDANNILMHYKLEDDVLDKSGAGRGFIDKVILRRHYKKSRARLPHSDEVCREQYKQLRRLEKENCADIDRVAHPFALIMREIGREVFAEKYTEDIGSLLYNLGRWVYLIDAVDDLEKDREKGSYNPFLAGYDFSTRERFIKDKEQELNFIFNACQSAIMDAFDKISTPLYEGVLTNILWYGLPATAKTIIGGNKIAKKSLFSSGIER